MNYFVYIARGPRGALRIGRASNAGGQGGLDRLVYFELFQTVGYERSVDVAAAAAGNDGVFEPIADLFTTDDIGGWDELNETVFGPDGAFTNALAAAQG